MGGRYWKGGRTDKRLGQLEVLHTTRNILLDIIFTKNSKNEREGEECLPAFQT